MQDFKHVGINGLVCFSENNSKITAAHICNCWLNKSQLMQMDLRDALCYTQRWMISVINCRWSLVKLS